MARTVLSVITAYLVGAIPTAYILARLFRGVDIRQHGSGNVGATNLARIMGKKAGIFVFILDFAKGFVGVTVIPVLFFDLFRGSGSPAELMLVLSGGASIIGHIWPVYLRFKGGKGVSTTAGVIAGLHPGILLGSLVIWGIVFAVWKYVSLSSITAAIALPVLALATGQDLVFVIFSGILCILGVYAHRKNIQRLLRGEETRIVKVKKSQ
ncbi:MAG: glycerol-3-phosphate 1-O-acyltransferase PlsY [Candidatus Omnitrophica bacterium]|nr:glycerol-3-phosphate 1-O-acyltransferase PlsY [Candidatus Omnitrophota bacterium]